MKTSLLILFSAFNFLFCSSFLSAQKPIERSNYSELSYHFPRTENFEKIYNMDNPNSFLAKLAAKKKPQLDKMIYDRTGIDYWDELYLRSKGIKMLNYPNMEFETYEFPDTAFYLRKEKVNIVLSKAWSIENNEFVPEYLEFFHYFEDAKSTLKTYKVTWQNLLNAYGFSPTELSVFSEENGDIIFSKPSGIRFLSNEIPFLSHFSPDKAMQFNFLDSVELESTFKTSDKESLFDFLKESSYAGKLNLYSYHREYDYKPGNQDLKRYLKDSFLISSLFSYRYIDPQTRPLESVYGGDSLYFGPDGSIELVYPAVENFNYQFSELKMILIQQKLVYNSTTKKWIANIDKISPIFYNVHRNKSSNQYWFDWEEIKQLFDLSKEKKPAWFTILNDNNLKTIPYQQWIPGN